MKENMTLIYLAGALRGENKDANMKAAQFWAEQLWRRGFAVYSPHMNSGWLDTPETDPHVLEANIQLMKMCDIMVIMPFYEESKGTLAEIKVYREIGKPIFYINDNRELLKKGILKLITDQEKRNVSI